MWVGTHRRQLVEAGEEFVERHHQLLRRALGGQAGEALDVSEQDAVTNTTGTERKQDVKMHRNA